VTAIARQLHVMMWQIQHLHSLTIDPTVGPTVEPTVELTSVHLSSRQLDRLSVQLLDW